MTSMRRKMREHSRLGVRTAWAGLLALASMLGSFQTATAGETFFDDFAHFDKERWYISDGWSNGAHQNCLWSDAAVAHEDGRMSLYFYYDITPEHEYRCGEIQTRPRFRHGTFEARIRTNEGSGLNAAFFTYIGPVHGEPHDEIDFEVLTANTQEVTVNTYVDGKQFHGAVRAMPQPASAQFHTYSFIWEAERMRWFIDGKLIHSVKDTNLPARPQKIYLSIWGTETLNDWMGPFEHPQAPKRMDIDWVSYTAPGEGCQFAGSVLCELAEN